MSFRPSVEMLNPAAEITDILIVGAGIVGLSLAKELRHRHPDLKIIILEKEGGLARHSSGRNSGVLHSGIYYPEDTLKAKVCAEGAQALREYCQANHLSIRNVGKVILPTVSEQDVQLDVLYQRGLRNNAIVEWIDERQLSEIEPDVKTASNRALYLPNAAVFDPIAVVRHLAQELIEKKVDIRLAQRIEVIDVKKRKVQVNQNMIAYGHLINTAGLQADLVAKKFDLAQHYTMIPFKGLYYELNKKTNVKINGLVYPVPDLRMPFLGVHFTRSVDGKVYVGPTAIPALGRENYGIFDGMAPNEAITIFLRLIQQYFIGPHSFREYAHQEAGRFFKPLFLSAAKGLVPDIRLKDLMPSTKVGIRPQLLDLKSNQLILDFLVEQEANSTHVLNAISPAFTCAFAFSKFLIDHYL